MARLVVPQAPAAKLAKAPPPGAPPSAAGDEYKDRLVKYIPAESVALYAFTDKLLSSYYGLDAAGQTKLPPDLLLAYLPWVLFLLGLIGTPLYLWRQRKPGQPWGLHAIIGTIAFVLWAYTLEGSLFVLHGWYNILLAGLAAPIFTFVAGIFEPR